jgi:hypothetical protein
VNIEISFYVGRLEEEYVTEYRPYVSYIPVTRHKPRQLVTSSAEHAPGAASTSDWQHSALSPSAEQSEGSMYRCCAGLDAFPSVTVTQADLSWCTARSVLHGNPTPFMLMAEQHARFEVFTAVTMKNGVFWDIKTQFVPHRRHITSPLQSPAS